MLLLVLLITLLATSCQNEELFIDKNENNSNSEIKNMGTYPSNQMIIQYKATMTEAEKENLRNQYDVVTHKNCKCADPTLELWIFASDRNPRSGGITIEEKVLGAKEDSDLEGVDFNLNINRIGRGLLSSFGPEDIRSAMQKRVLGNQNVTIAVLDTGVDYNYFGFTTSFLYNNQNTCNDNPLQDYYGWDFVNEDNDPFDDYGHGTIVTSIIYDKLQEQNVNFQILPIKVFDNKGKGNLFDLLCGFKYAVNNPDVNIINMSFGWYGTNYELLNKFIMQSQQNVLITASAGNDKMDTDLNAHYPSVFDSENILSIAALQGERDGDISSFGGTMLGTGLAQFSNFGTITVDIAAKGENIPFYIDDDNYIPVSGTSFSTAFATALGGEKYMPNISVEQHKASIIENTIQNSSLSQIKYASYIPD